MNIELDSICRTYLFSCGYNTTHRYLRTMKFLVEFLAKFSRNHTYMDIVEVLRVDEKYAVQLPASFVSLNSLAFTSGDRIIKFERDRTINLNQSYCEDEVSATPNLAYNIYQAFPYNRPLIDTINSCQFSSLGVGHNGAGYFNFNWPAREIQFSTDSKLSGGVYISYKSNGFKPTTKSTIPEFAAQLAEAYIHWQMARMDRRLGDSAAETQARKVNFLAEYDDMLASLDSIDFESIMGIRARAFDQNKIAL